MSSSLWKRRCLSWSFSPLNCWGPIGWGDARPNIGRGLLVFELLPSVFSTGMGGVGGHSDGDVVGGGVWGREIVSMNGGGDLLATKQVINNARVLLWLLSFPWEPRGSQIDVRSRGFRAGIRKEMGDLICLS